LKLLQDQHGASMDEMEKDYLEQLQTIEDENEKLKLSISEGDDLLSQCQRALTLASQKSATLAVREILHKYALFQTHSLTLLRINWINQECSSSISNKKISKPSTNFSFFKKPFPILNKSAKSWKTSLKIIL
jgi:hypothetical protein